MKLYSHSARLCVRMRIKLENGQPTKCKAVDLTIAIKDIYQISIVQECKVLEDLLETSVLVQCLSRPHDAPKIVREHRSIIGR